MAVNRYRNLAPTLDPTLYQYTPVEYLPDLSGLGDVLQGMQSVYDASANLPIPKHIQTPGEIADLKTRYLEPLESAREGAISSFTEGDIPGGLRAMKDLERQIKTTQQPGGLYSQYEQSYAAYQDYNKQLDDLYKKGDISKDKLDALKTISKSQFKSSFDEAGVFNPFSGISAARDTKPVDLALERAKGWKADQIASGALVRDPSGAGYMYATTKEYVDPNEVKNAIASSLYEDDEVIQDLLQRAMIYGYTGDDATNYVKEQVNQAAEIAAAKEGFTKTDKKWYQDWQLKQSRQHKHDFDLQEAADTRQMVTNFIQVATGAKKLDVDKDGKVKVSDKQIKTPLKGKIGGLTIYGSTLGGVKTDASEYKTVGIDVAVKENPQLLKEHPGLNEFIEMIPRYYTDDNGVTKIKSDTEYNKEVGEAYNNYVEDASSIAIGYDAYTDAKEVKNDNDILFGAGESPGEFPHRAYTLLSPGKPPQVVSPEKILEIAQADNLKDLRNRASVTGKTRADSPFGANSFVITLGDKRGGAYTVIGSPTSVKEANYMQGFNSLLKPGWDLEMKESNPVPITDPTTGQTRFYKSRRELERDPSGRVIPNLNFYEAIPDEEGNLPLDAPLTDPRWTPTNLTKEQIEEAASISNPFK